MYMLGIIYATFPGKVDNTLAVYWLSMCRDYNKQVKFIYYSSKVLQFNFRNCD